MKKGSKKSSAARFWKKDMRNIEIFEDTDAESVENIASFGRGKRKSL